MEIITAKSAGFCFGVNRAIEACYNEIEKGGRIVTYGPLIHNKNVNKDLENKGVKSVDTLDGCEGATVIIRSHGVGKAVYDELERRNIHYVDGTCPFVKKIHNIVRKKRDEGYEIIIIGDGKHPEVIGINGWCDNSAITIDNVDDAQKLILDDEKKYAVVVQTTFRENKFYDILKILKEKSEKITEENEKLSTAKEVENTEKSSEAIKEKYKYAKGNIRIFKDTKITPKAEDNIKIGTRVEVLEVKKVEKVKEKTVKKPDGKTEVQKTTTVENWEKISYYKNREKRTGWIKNNQLADSLKATLPKEWKNLDFSPIEKKNYPENRSKRNICNKQFSCINKESR